MVTKEDWPTLAHRLQLSTDIIADYPMDIGGYYLHYSTGSDGCARRTMLVGLGVGEELQIDTLQTAACRAVAEARARGLDSMSLDVAPWTEGMGGLRLGSAAPAEAAAAVARAAHLANYAFHYGQGEPPKEGASGEGRGKCLERVVVVGTAAQREHVERARLVANATLLARNLGNLRGDECTPDYFENFVRAAVQAQPHLQGVPALSLEVVGGADVEAQGLRLLHAVGRQATSQPRLLVLRYMGDPTSDQTVAVLGKGVTFDTGGLNLKGTGAIEGMHMDMAGAAAVAAAMLALPQLRLRANVVAAMPLAENAVGPRAVKPLAVVQSLKGEWVEVGNTDAEGRLILADALTWLQRKHRPSHIVDLATLTGACVVALGEYAGGLFTNNPQLQQALTSAGSECQERVWAMPILKEHSEELKPRGRHAHLRSTGKGKGGGACTAAAFLQHFIEPLPGLQGGPLGKVRVPAWAHLDIAGPAMFSEARGFNPQGATGFGAATLLHWLRNHALSK